MSSEKKGAAEIRLPFILAEFVQCCLNFQNKFSTVLTVFST